MVRLKACIALTAVSLAAIPSAASLKAEAQRVLDSARISYQKGDYESTARRIRSYLKDKGRDESTELIVPLLIETLMRTGDLELSEKLLVIYFRKFPQSVFIPRLTYLQAIIKARQEAYIDAVDLFSRALTAGLTPQLDSLAWQNIAALCEKALTAEELETVANRQGVPPRVSELAKYNQTLKHYKMGQAGKARQAAEEFGKNHARSPFSSTIKDIQNKTKASQRDQIPVGLLAPISGYDADIGKRIVQGVQLAVDKHNKTNTPRINLVISDTRSSMVETAKKTLELLNVHDVRVIIGPILSQNAVVTAAMLADKDVIMITPTATEDGIAELSRTIFQMNVTMGVLGKQIARYALENLNMREFAIISPLSEYGRLLSESFKNQVIDGGGEIVAEEYFDEGTTDFRQQFANLRRKLVQHKRMKEAVESAQEYGTIRPFSTADSLRYADSTLSIGGLFIPAETDDVVMLAPQVFFYKIRTQMLGATGWHSSKTILDGKRYVEDALIVTSFDDNRQSQLWQQFSGEYHRRFSTEPDRVAALGFDAADLICEVLANMRFGMSTENMVEALLSVENRAGVSGGISFDKRWGMNTEAAIIKISNKKFIRVQ